MIFTSKNEYPHFTAIPGQGQGQGRVIDSTQPQDHKKMMVSVGVNGDGHHMFGVEGDRNSQQKVNEALDKDKELKHGQVI